MSEELIVGLVSVSDRASAGVYQDEGIPALKSWLGSAIAAPAWRDETRLIADERPLIAGVFLNRLRKGMRLQTDPSVIYGIGEKFDGNLRRRDLRTDTPYNTYTRIGLPPTPIALVGSEALEAAVNPAKTDALYFVATGLGDGRHYFADTLIAHNRNVSRHLSNLRRSAGVRVR